LEEKLGAAATVKLIWKPQTVTNLDEDKASTMLKLIAALEDDDDVQEVYANFEISDEVLAKLTAE
ncbi:MAG: YebC/PmpR family DNA-binding transcriptional regulator, partial [Alphaproteobacteria bacterium]